MVSVYRQGDLILRRWNIAVVSELKPGNMVGDRLEVRSETGHAHVIEAPVYNLYGNRLVVVEKPTPLTHPQHATIIIPPGIYQVTFVRDYRDVRFVRPRD